MITEGIIIAIITGIFSLSGIIVQRNKCYENSKKIKYKRPTDVFDTVFEPPSLLDCYEYITEKDNGNIDFSVPPGLKMKPSNTIGIANLFCTYNKKLNKKSNKKILRIKVKNMKGYGELFIKRFDSDYNFIEFNPITTVKIKNGYNEIHYTSQIGEENTKIEQLGLMIYSNDILSCIPCRKCSDYNNRCKKCIKKNSNKCTIYKAIIEDIKN